MLICAYCECQCPSFDVYKSHLKILHNKQKYGIGNMLLCGQNGCPLSFCSFQALKRHICKQHAYQHVDDEYPAKAKPFESFTANLSHSNNQDSSVNEPAFMPFRPSLAALVDKINSNDGIFEDAAVFIARLRSHPCLSLSTTLEIVAMCGELIQSIVDQLLTETKAVLNDNVHSSTDVANLLEAMNVLRSPFSGLETLYKQTRYFEQRGLYIAPNTVPVGQILQPVKCGNKIKCKTKALTLEFVCQESCIKAFLALPGVLDHIRSHLSEQVHDVICDFKDGALWKNHPIRLKHSNSSTTVVIPVFDYFDDVEVANPLGSHATIHKIGSKYTSIKGIQPKYNSRLENILLNAVINSNDRTAYSNSAVFDAYLTEMQKLEKDGFDITVDSITYKVYVVVVQLTGDNLGLNGVLGYVESFTARHPCRICKADRESFSVRFTEDASIMRTRDTYTSDLALTNPTETGIKEVCCYNQLGSFHVADNVYCDIMHDLFEGVCRYVVSKLLKYLIIEKKG
jgi:hypothetical protein